MIFALESRKYHKTRSYPKEQAQKLRPFTIDLTKAKQGQTEAAMLVYLNFFSGKAWNRNIFMDISQIGDSL